MPKTLIIGAGVSGLTSLKCSLDADLGEVHCFEQSKVIGGLWNYRETPEVGQGSVIESTVTNSSKEITSFSDFPFPDTWPNFLSHSKFMKYLEMYVEEFSLRSYIRLEHKVINVSKCSEGGFTITYKTADDPIKSDTYDFVMVCNGIFFDPNIITFPNQEKFEGEIIHSLDYKTPENYRDNNVCVVGFGNTAADIASEVARVAKQVYLSTRSGAFLKRRTGYDGLPDDFISNSRLRYIIKKWQPRWYKERTLEKRLNGVLNSSVYGIRPKQGLSKSFLTISDDIQSKLTQGAVELVGDIARFHEHSVEFSEGSGEVEIDTVVMATGYKPNCSFLSPSIYDSEDQLNLYLKMFLPSCDNLAFIGYTTPMGSIPPISELQARYACQVFKGSIKLPSQTAMEKITRKNRRCVSNKQCSGVRYQFTLNRFAYQECLADGIGCRPGINRLLGDPVLAWRCWTGAFTTQQYRLFGPNKWAGARSSLLGNRERMLTPFAGVDIPGWTLGQVLPLFSSGIAVIGFIIYKIFKS